MSDFDYVIKETITRDGVTYSTSISAPKFPLSEVCSNEYYKTVRFTAKEYDKMIRMVEHKRSVRMLRFHYKFDCTWQRRTGSFDWFDVIARNGLSQKSYVLSVGKPRYSTGDITMIYFGEEVPTP